MAASNGLFSGSVPTKPKVALFGDSISSAVGYGQDSQPDTQFGGSVSDILSKQLGTSVANLAAGGITTKDALTGSPIPYMGKDYPIPYGNFQQYLQTEKPNVVLLRFGAADAIRLNDPKQTLANLQQMVTMAKEAGAKPILIGVSPFAKGGDSRAGNINAGSIDPYIGAADEINRGIQQLAEQNGLNFVDMQKLEVPEGALLDGVHPTAEFGKQMAEYIGNAVTSALPEFGGSAEQFKAFSQSEPSKALAAANAVKTGAQQNMAVPSTEFEFSPAARQALTQGGLEGIRPSRVKTEMIGDDLQTYEKLSKTGGDWSGKQITYQVLDAYGNPAGTTTVSDQGIQGALEAAAPLIAMGLTAGGAGGLLGGALTGGSLTGTAASALGNALISGGAGALTGQDPLKAALLAAGGTYAGGLFGGGADATTITDAQAIAEEANWLAAQGMDAAQIEEILKAHGVNTSTAALTADSAASGMSTDLIANDIALGNRSLFTDPSKVVTPSSVTTGPEGLQTATITNAAPVVNAGGLLGGLAAAVPSAVTTQPNLTTADLGPLADQQVTVTGTQQPTTLDNALAAIVPALVSAPTSVTTPADQVIDVTGTAKPNTTNDNLAATLAATVNPTAVTTGATTTVNPADQVVEVTGTAKPQQNIGDVAAAINAGTLYGPGMTGTQTSVYDKVLETTDSKTAADTAATLAGSLSLSDILKALTSLSSLGLLSGGGGGGGTAATPMAPTTPVPVGNADYYKAIQQYYNTYMPQTPRDVATPLQQWYEGKFGG
jgi:lysophospholipase L1-like esterase